MAELAAQVGLGQVGIVLALEVSRLARNHAGWYRLLDLAAMTDTLVADTDGVYHPRRFDDRLVLGMKGTMAEAELHILRTPPGWPGCATRPPAASCDAPCRSAGLGRRRWRDPLAPDEAVTGVIRAVFERFAACGAARSVWLWLREQNLQWPLQPAAYLHGEEIVWVAPSYHAVHNTLTHPAYAGADVDGRTRLERRLGTDGLVRTHRRARAPRPMAGPHRGPPRGVHQLGGLPGQPGQDRREHPSASPPTGHRRGARGCALLQGLAVCGACGRKLAVFYQGPAKATPG